MIQVFRIANIYYAKQSVLFCATNSACLGFDTFSDAVEDLIDYAKSVDSDVFAFFFVVLLKRFCLIVIDFETIFDGVDVVVGTTCLLTTLNHTIDKFFFRHFETYDCMQVCATKCLKKNLSIV